MNNPLVSIIIPTFNRASLLSETLDSIIAQTYLNWESIVVDDGSSDNTLKLLKKYSDKDNRIKYFKRPNTYKKGANSCRNFGFEKSNGDFINWFDSDDLMEKNAIEIKINKLLNSSFDFVVSKTENFNEDKLTSKINYGFNDEINLYNFITQSNFWMTPDALISKKIVRDVKFNDSLDSGQEFNYFSKMLINSTNAVIIENVLTKRRVHENSIQEKQKVNKSVYRLNKYKVNLITLKDIYHKADVKSKNHLLQNAMSKSFEILINNEKIPSINKLTLYVLKLKGFFKLTLFLLSLFLARFFKVGYKLMNYSRK